MFNRICARGAAIAFVLAAAGCATESSHTVQVQAVQAAATPYSGVRVPVSIGKFDNHSSFMRGVFSDGVDRLGGQARGALISHLQQSNRFAVQDRDNLTDAGQEAKLKGVTQALRGAAFIITGDVAEFGRKETGDEQLFGLLGRGKRQVAYAKVTLNVIDTTTSEVVFSASGAGEYELSSREVIGFGGTAGYDATLNGKVIDLAMRDAVDRVVAAKDAGQWGR